MVALRAPPLGEHTAAGEQGAVREKVRRMVQLHSPETTPRYSRRRFLTLTGGIAASALLAACGGKQTSQGGSTPTAGNTTSTTTPATTSAPATATPARTTTGGTKEIHGAASYQLPPNGHFNLLEGVTQGILAPTIYYDLVLAPSAMYYWKEQKWMPLLAEKWGFDANAGTFTINLKSGLKWSDGSPLTSQDYLATFWCEWVLRNVLWKYVKTVEAPNDTTIILRLSDVSSVVERYALKLHIVPAKLYGQYGQQAQQLAQAGKTQDDPEAKALLDQITRFRPDQILASGPFQFDYKSITNAQLVLVKNPNGVMASTTHFDRVVLYNYTGLPDLTTLVLSKQIDYHTGAFPPPTEKALIQQGFRIIRPPIYSGPALGFNLDKVPEFKDKRVRQALAYLIDRNQSGAVSLGDSGKGVKYMAGFSDVLLPSWLDADAMGKLNTYQRDPNKAAQLLTAAGWKQTGDGWQTPDGKPAKYELVFPSGYPDWSASAQNIADQLKPAFQITLRSIDTPQYTNEIAKGNFQWAILAWGSSSSPHPHFSFVQDLFTNNIPIAANFGGRGMAFELKQQTDVVGPVDLEQLVVQAAAGLDQAKQRQTVTTLALAFNELLPIIPLWERYGNNPVLENVRVKPWPPDSNPIYLNSPYGDNFGIMMLMDGTLQPV